MHGQQEWNNLWDKNWTVKPETCGALRLTAGQVGRWFIETYKAEFEDENSPLYGLSADSFQDIMIYLKKGSKPTPDMEADPQNAAQVNLRREVLNIFLQDWLRMFRLV